MPGPEADVSPNGRKKISEFEGKRGAGIAPEENSISLDPVARSVLNWKKIDKCIN